MLLSPGHTALAVLAHDALPVVAVVTLHLLLDLGDLVRVPGAAHLAGVAEVGAVVAGLGAAVTRQLLVYPARGLALVLQKVASELHPKVRNHGEGPY